MMNFMDQLREIVANNPFPEDEVVEIVYDTIENREFLVEAIRELPLGRTDILVFAVVQNEDGTGVTGKVAGTMSSDNAKTACLQYLRTLGVVPAGTNPMLDSLRGLLPPGHPLKEGVSGAGDRIFGGL